jgi:hypothetical protein
MITNMEIEIKDMKKDMYKLMTDVALIKSVLFEERELTDWAKSELKKAREGNEEEYISLEKL